MLIHGLGAPAAACILRLAQPIARSGLDRPLDPIVKLFDGNTRELLAAVERVTGSFSERCEICEASDHEAFE